MKTVDIEALGKAAYHTPIKPLEIRGLGKDAHVYAVRLYGHSVSKGGRCLKLVGVSLTNGERSEYFSPDQLPAQGRHGLNVGELAAAIYQRLGLNTKQRIVLICHGSAENYSVLDVHSLDSRLSFTPAGHDAFSLKWLDKKAGRSLEFIDLASFFPDRTLRQVGEEFGLSAGLDEQKRPDPADEFTQMWLKQQAALCWTIFNRLRLAMQTAWGIDPAVYRTPASCAARVYTSSYLPAPVGLVRKQVRYQALLSFWGSRVEAFFRGRQSGTICEYDAVSLYPQAAINLGVMPLEHSWYRATMSSLKSCAGGVVTVEFEFPDDELFPCLPVNAAGHLKYPLAGISHCTAHEVRYALELGAKITLLDGWCYDRGDDSLARYSADLLAQKKAADAAGDTAQRTMYKMLLNALYGKFSQHRVEHSLETMRDICRVCGIPSLADLVKVHGWEQRAGDMMGLDEPIQPEVTIGGQWVPEWGALIHGYARMVESRAIRDYVALSASTDAVILADDVGERFFIEGVEFKRAYTGDQLVLIRSRLYAISQGGELVKVALHGAPKMHSFAKRLQDWNGETEIKLEAGRVRKLRDGLTAGQVVGKENRLTITVSLDWDKKRILQGDYTTPFAFVSGDALTPA